MAPSRTATLPTEQERVALAEIELCGELIIAASAADGERLSADRIDEVLRVAGERAEGPGPVGRAGTRAGRPDEARRPAGLGERDR
ncbi:hypothetical protein [Streptomyces sp. NPDC053755]|uniref:hypothetical protein n=1 Tax=Streptomyces sp. NPDC053755 TaxID=3155815 RepID=UPI0034333D30